MGIRGETAKANTALLPSRTPPCPLLQTLYPQDFKNWGGDWEKMRSVPAPCHHHQPCYVPSPAWASDAGLGPALAHHYSKAPSPLPRNSIADWPPPAPERPSEGRREARRGVGRTRRSGSLHRPQRFRRSSGVPVVA